MVKADRPGLKKGGDFVDGYLTFKGERGYVREEKKEHYRRMKSTHGTFRKSVEID